ncbi:hypothetical protein T484DRAFT_1869926, partial [Baffinella frigidus]
MVQGVETTSALHTLLADDAEPPGRGAALFPLLSKFNHACRPSVAFAHVTPAPPDSVNKPANEDAAADEDAAA